MLPLVSQLGAKYDTWIDWEDIEVGTDWEKRLYEGIAQSDVFLFLLTANSAASKWCRDELQAAKDWGKRIIPVLFTKEPPSNTPDICKKLQYCFAEQQSSLGIILERRKDESKLHSDLLVTALDWERRSKPNNRLLKGRNLRKAVTWLQQSDDAPPMPTHIHREFILSSQVAERDVFAIASTSFVGLLTIGAALLVGFDLQQRADGTREYSFHGDRVQPNLERILTASGIVGVLGLGLKGR